MSPLLLIVCALLVIAIWKVKKIYSFWNDKGIPHLTFWQNVKVAYENFTKPLNDSVVDDYRKYGRVYGTYEDIGPCVVVGDPEMIRQIFQKDFASFSERAKEQKIGKKLWDRMVINLSGPEWKHCRSILSAANTTVKLKAMVPKLTRAWSRGANFLVELALKNEVADLMDIFMKSSLDAIAAAGLSVDIDSNRDPDNKLRRHYINMFAGDEAWKAVMLVRMPRLYKLLRIDIVSEEYGEIFSALIKEIIEQRARSNTKPDDPLQLLLDAMAAKNTQDEAGHDATNQHCLASGKYMTMDDVVSQAFALLLAGNDTVASALVSTVYSLAMHEKCQDKVIQEIDVVIGEDEATYESLQSLQYLDAVINEALRIYSVTPYIGRVCAEEVTVGGIHFTPGMTVNTPVQAMHMDPEFFPEPEAFKPERFLPENRSDIRPFTFMPFGAGPRNCAGIRQAMLQMKIALACIYQKVKFERCSETVDQIRLKPRFVTRELATPIRLRVIRRR